MLSVFTKTCHHCACLVWVNSGKRQYIKRDIMGEDKRESGMKQPPRSVGSMSINWSWVFFIKSRISILFTITGQNQLM